MNNVILVGRLTRDPELKYVGSCQNAVVDFTVAVDRNYKSKNGSNEADFIKVEAWNNNAEFCAKYLTKGRLVGIDGSIRVDKYKNEDGENRYITKVNANRIKFLDYPKKEESFDNKNKYYQGNGIFEENCITVDIAEEDIPF